MLNNRTGYTCALKNITILPKRINSEECLEFHLNHMQNVLLHFSKDVRRRLTSQMLKLVTQLKPSGKAEQMKRHK